MPTSAITNATTEKLATMAELSRAFARYRETLGRLADIWATA